MGNTPRTMLLPDSRSRYVTPFMTISYGGTPAVNIKVRELEAPSQASPVPVSVALVGVDPTVMVMGVPRLAGTQLLLS